MCRCMTTVNNGYKEQYKNNKPNIQNNTNATLST